MENPPSQSLYIRNLNEKINKQELRQSLYYLFSQYGRILDVVALKTLKMRGQAFVAFCDITSATNALRSLENFTFYDRPMRLSYARSKSHAYARYRGEVPGAATEEKKKQPREKRKATDDGGKPAKKVAQAPASDTTPAPSKSSEAPSTAKPNKILFCSNLPDESRETSESMLGMLFQQFPGYKEVRLIEGRHDIAFVEFASEEEAAAARDALQGFRISPQHLMKIEFAKK